MSHVRICRPVRSQVFYFELSTLFEFLLVVWTVLHNITIHAHVHMYIISTNCTYGHQPYYTFTVYTHSQ